MLFATVFATVALVFIILLVILFLLDVPSISDFVRIDFLVIGIDVDFLNTIENEALRFKSFKVFEV